MTRRAAPSKPVPSYAKISATLEERVLREIRERTTNVSGFLNEAASEKLYFEHLQEMDEELERQGVPIDEKLYQGLLKLMDEHEDELRRRRRGVRKAATR